MKSDINKYLFSNPFACLMIGKIRTTTSTTKKRKTWAKKSRKRNNRPFSLFLFRLLT